MTVPLKPLDPLPVIGDENIQLVPKPFGVVFYLHVRELMHDHIIDDWKGSHDQTPGKAQGAFMAARSPTGAGRRDLDLLINNPIFFCIKLDSLGDYPEGLFPVPTFKHQGGFRKRSLG